MQKIFHSRYFTRLLIVMILGTITVGCYSQQEITKDYSTESKIYKIELEDSLEVDFSESITGFATELDDSLINFKSNGEKEVFPKSKISKYYTEIMDYKRTVRLIIGITGAIAVIILIPYVICLSGGC